MGASGRYEYVQIFVISNGTHVPLTQHNPEQPHQRVGRARVKAAETSNSRIYLLLGGWKQLTASLAFTSGPFCQTPA